MIDPILVILAPPAIVFAWAIAQMHRAPEETRETARLKVDV